MEKTCFILAVLLMAACEVLEFRGDPGEEISTGVEKDTVMTAPPVLDTFLLVSAVSFPADYDWRRDTACGAVDFEVVLYKDMERQLAIRSSEGVSPDPDMHHLIGGHIYSEGSFQDRTVIWRDGKLLVSFEQREYLLGIVEGTDGVYTLGRRRSGGGFSFRKDGKQVYGSESGQVLGNLFNTAYPASGALYMDEGEICFFFLDGEDYSRRLYVCEGGTVRKVADIGYREELLDARLQAGKICYLIQNSTTSLFHLDSSVVDVGKSRSIVWQEAGIGFRGGGEWYIAGDMTASGVQMAGMLGQDGDITRLGEAGSYLYRDGEIVVPLSVKKGTSLAADYYFFNSRCACLFGGRMYEALTPRSKGKKAAVLLGTRRKELEINGFLTGIDMAVAPR